MKSFAQSSVVSSSVRPMSPSVVSAVAASIRCSILIIAHEVRAV